MAVEVVVVGCVVVVVVVVVVASSTCDVTSSLDSVSFPVAMTIKRRQFRIQKSFFIITYTKHRYVLFVIDLIHVWFILLLRSIQKNTDTRIVMS